MVKLATKGRKLNRVVPDSSTQDVGRLSRVVLETSTQDIRSRSVERKRDREQKAKWSPRWAHAGNPPATYEGPNGASKPVIRLNKKCTSSYVARCTSSSDRHQDHEERKRPVLNVDTWREESTEDDFDYVDSDDSTGAADVDIKYSYDAQTGPAEGEAVLEMAVTKALERFEDDQTTKLINDEYEVLDPSAEAEFYADHTVTAEDDGFELV